MSLCLVHLIILTAWGEAATHGVFALLRTTHDAAYGLLFTHAAVSSLSFSISPKKQRRAPLYECESTLA